jgi:hypothetical protein
MPDGLTDHSAVADEAFRTRLNANVTVDFHHCGKHGRRALFADPNQFLRE